MRLSGHGGLMPCLCVSSTRLTPCELRAQSTSSVMLHAADASACYQAGGCMAPSWLSAFQQHATCPELQLTPVTHKALAMRQADGVSGSVSSMPHS